MNVYAHLHINSKALSLNQHPSAVCRELSTGPLQTAPALLPGSMGLKNALTD